MAERRMAFSHKYFVPIQFVVTLTKRLLAHLRLATSQASEHFRNMTVRLEKNQPY